MPAAELKQPSTCLGVSVSMMFAPFQVESSAIEWTGTCQAGNCKVCREEETRCRQQVCVNGEWTYKTAMEFSMAHRAEKGLLAATVLIGCCFLALLGVITTLFYMLQQQHKRLPNLQALSTARQEPFELQQVHPPQGTGAMPSSSPLSPRSNSSSLTERAAMPSAGGATLAAAGTGAGAILDFEGEQLVAAAYKSMYININRNVCKYKYVYYII